MNVIAPLVTNADGVLRQTIDYPYAWALEHARGNALRLSPECETYDVPRVGPVPYLDVAATHDPEAGRACLLILNRSSRPRSAPA